MLHEQEGLRLHSRLVRFLFRSTCQASEVLFPFLVVGVVAVVLYVRAYVQFVQSVRACVRACVCVCVCVCVPRLIPANSLPTELTRRENLSEQAMRMRAGVAGVLRTTKGLKPSSRRAACTASWMAHSTEVASSKGGSPTPCHTTKQTSKQTVKTILRLVCRHTNLKKIATNQLRTK